MKARKLVFEIFRPLTLTLDDKGLLTNQFWNHESGFSRIFDQFDEFLQVLEFVLPVSKITTILASFWHFRGTFWLCKYVLE